VLDGILCRNNPLKYVDPSGHSWGSFFKSLVSAFVGAVAFVATGGVAAAAWTASFIGSCAAAGAASGATSAALNGGNVIQGAITGGIIGGASGGIFGSIPGSGPYLLAGGAGYATATGGLEGLADFGAGVLGANLGLTGGQYALNGIEGHGFRSNNAVYADFRASGDEKGGLAFLHSRYGGVGAQNYNENKAYFAGKQSAAVYDGDEVWYDPRIHDYGEGYEQLTSVHELRHVYQNTSGLYTNTQQWALEVDAYRYGVDNAWRLNVSPGGISRYQGLIQTYQGRSNVPKYQQTPFE